MSPKEREELLALFLIRMTRMLSVGLILATMGASLLLADERPDKKLIEEGRKNIKMLQEAMIGYQLAHNSFPPQAFQSAAGKPTLSWRVALLPHLGDDAAKLYKEFKLTEAWNSTHNKKLLAKMPKVYAPLAKAPNQPHLTYYQVFTGPRTPFKPGKLEGPRMGQFRDGLANTALIAEAGEAVPWTKPADLVVEEKKPLPKLGGMFRGMFHVAMANGEDVHLIRRDFDEKNMRLIIDPDDAQVMDFGKVMAKP